MVNKIKYYMAQTYGKRGFPLTNVTAFSVQGGLDEDSFNLSVDFFEELASFAERNKIDCGEHPGQVCLNCLKAHAYKILNEKEHINQNLFDMIPLFNCEMGHNGYYQDGSKIIQISY